MLEYAIEHICGSKNLNYHKTTTGGFYKWLKKSKVVKLQIPAGKATPAPPSWQTGS